MTVSPIPAASNACRGVTSVTSYEAAERAVDWLSDHSFPVEHVSIVGTGLRYVEQIGGRLTTGRAALTGTAQGAMIGLFWGLIFGLLFTVDGAGFFGVLAYSVAVGAVFGAVIRAVGHYASRGRRDFSSASQTRAERYEVQVDEDYAPDAARLLDRMPAR
jgi:hypothetical protein